MNRILRKYFPLLVAILSEAQNFELLYDLMLFFNERRRDITYIRPRGYSDILNDILNGDNAQTKMHLRVSASSFRKIVEFIPAKHHGWSKEYEVVCFLYWMACGCSYRVAAGFMGLSRYTVRNIVHKLLNEFIKLRHVINHGNAEDYQRISEKFCRKSKTSVFKNFIGAIDGTHIRIQCPVNKHDEYINHKKFYSIQAQAVVDSDYKFTSVFIGYPGSVHDTRVFLNSPLYNSGSYPPSGYCLFGDSGYPCQLQPVAVITPFKEPCSSNQKRFNSAHSKARITVECAFGMLKQRWRSVFNRDLELSTKNCIKTAFAAFVLHNICILQEDFQPLSDAVPLEDENSYQREDVVTDSAEGVIVRNILFNEFLETSDIS